MSLYVKEDIGDLLIRGPGSAAERGPHNRVTSQEPDHKSTDELCNIQYIILLVCVTL